MMEELLKRSVFFPDREYRRASNAINLLVPLAYWVPVIFERRLHSTNAVYLTALLSVTVGILLWVTLFFTNRLLQRYAETAARELVKLVSSGAKGETVTVQKMKKLFRPLPRMTRRAAGTKGHAVEYQHLLDESFEAYLFVLPGIHWNVLRQHKFVVPKAEMDAVFSKVA